MKDFYLQNAETSEQESLLIALRERLFQPFQSGENSKGLGLGLYLAKSIALIHGGDLILDEKVSDGASFLLRLPIRSESS